MKQVNLLWLADETQVQADVEEREGFRSCRKWSVMQMVNKWELTIYHRYKKLSVYYVYKNTYQELSCVEVNFM
jgi:hypothetical protein